MLLITERVAIVEVVSQVIVGAWPGIPPIGVPVVCTATEGARMVFRAPSDAMLVVDTARQTWQSVRPVLQTWHMQRPTMPPLVLVPHLNPPHELDIVIRSGVRAPLILTAPKDLVPEAWLAPIRAAKVGYMADELAHHLVAQVAASGEHIVEHNRVLGVLNQAPYFTSVEAFHRYSGPERRAQERRFRKEGQRQTKELLTAFRWLWAVRLRETGWRAHDVALFLGYHNSTDAAKYLVRSVPITFGQLMDAGSTRMVKIFARELLRTHARVGLASLETIATTIGRQARSAAV